LILEMSITRPSHVLLLTCLELCLHFPAAGCHSASGSQHLNPDASTDADTDTDTTGDIDAGPEELPLACPGPVESMCGSTFEPYELVGTADELGVGVSLRAVAGNNATVLGVRDEGDGQPLVFATDIHGDWDDSHQTLEIGLSEPSPEPLDPVDLVAGYLIYSPDWGIDWSGSGVLGYGAIALLCGVSTCDLFGVVENEDPPAVLVPIPDSEVPVDTPRGVVLQAKDPPWVTETTPVCAFGEGVACFNGSEWWTALEPDSGSPVNAATVYKDDDTDFLIVAGDNGRLAIEHGDGFTEIETGTSANILSVKGGPEFLAAGAEDGSLVLMDSDELLVCPVVDEPIVLVRVDRWMILDEWIREVTAFTASGRVLELWGGGSEICEFEETLAGEPQDVIAWTPFPDVFNTLVITEEVIYDRIEFGWWE
jgi:hypothetical protein